MHADIIEDIATERARETSGDRLEPGEEFWVAGLGWLTYTPRAQ